MVRTFLATASILSAFATLPAMGQSQVLSYRWLNQPCADNLNCSEGCSACNLPSSDNASFLGTSMIWIGVQPPCPHPVTPGDNAIYTNGWPTFVQGTTYGKLSALTTTPLHVDSVIIVHRRAVEGPARLKVSYGQDPTMPMVEAADVEVPNAYTTTVITDLGCIEVPTGAAYGSFQLMLQPYSGNGDNWLLDELRIVGSPCSTTTTGIAEYTRYSDRAGTYYDVLGRPVGNDPAPGVYGPAPGVYNGPQRVVRVN
ncbi:MAG: hypothetical protein R2815_09995 [Flavobacteriales bacterium]|nr:hypothetical protein [Flavobacteriales bacterium]